MENSLEGRVIKVEGKVDGLEKKIDDLSDIKNIVIRLALLSEQQVEHNKKFTKTYEQLLISNTKLSSTLESVNDNITFLNEEIKCTGQRVSELEDKMDKQFKDSQKDSDKNDKNIISKLNEINDRSKVDLLELVKKSIAPLLLGGISFWILQLLGIIKVM